MSEGKRHGRFAGRELDKRSGKTTPLGEGMSGWFAAHGLEPRHERLLRLWENWEVVLGQNLAPMAQPLGHRNGILLVGADDSCLMQELSFAAPEILERVNAFMNEDFFHKVELHLLTGKASLRSVNITPTPCPPRPPRPRNLGRLTFPPDSPLAACYNAYLRCFDSEDEDPR